nr:MAG TPA: hypothetical protein [Caudoviricetes sp.]
MYSAAATACKYSIEKGESIFNKKNTSIYRTSYSGEPKQ